MFDRMKAKKNNRSPNSHNVVLTENLLTADVSILSRNMNFRHFYVVILVNFYPLADIFLLKPPCRII